jgi:hypothetical protein
MKNQRKGRAHENPPTFNHPNVSRDVLLLNRAFNNEVCVKKVTNKLGLPSAIVKAIINDPYSKGDSDYSVTELLKPPRLRRLTELHEHELEEDVEDSLYRLYGQIAHGILERGNSSDLAEKRFFADFNGKKISGQIDTLSLDSKKVLTDFKFTTVWKFKKDQPADQEWTAQLNMQLELLRRNGLDASALQIVGLIRDYRTREKLQFPDSYPDNAICIMPIEIWPRDKTTAFINMRIAEHEAAKVDLPNCSDNDRWAEPNIWAVMKGKKAIPGGKQFSQEAAEKMCSENAGTRVEFRKGTSKRCENYCAVSKFCVQYQSSLESKEIKDEVS